MGSFKFIKTGIDSLTIIKSQVCGDTRDYFMETWSLKDFKSAGLPMSFVQDNQSKSKKGILRELHFQKIHRENLCM